MLAPVSGPIKGHSCPWVIYTSASLTCHFDHTAHVHAPGEGDSHCAYGGGGFTSQSCDMLIYVKWTEKQCIWGQRGSGKETGAN